jgi:septum formation protein
MLVKLHPHLTTLRVVLASQSPRRADICKKLGLDVTVVPTDFLEDLDWRNYDRAEDYALATAAGKQAAFTSSGHPYDIAICADSIVACEDKVYEKAVSREHAAEIMLELQGRVHLVHTALIVTACRGDTVQSWSTVETSQVKFVALTASMIKAYLDCDEYWDKAGAYGVQTGSGACVVERIEGCFYNVMGMPATRLCKLMEEALNYLQS